MGHGWGCGLCGRVEADEDGGYAGLLLPASCRQCYSVKLITDHSLRYHFAVALGGTADGPDKLIYTSFDLDLKYFTRMIMI